MPSLFVIRISWESVTLGAGLTDESGRPIFVASVVATTEGKLALVSGATAGIRFAIECAGQRTGARDIKWPGAGAFYGRRMILPSARPVAEI